MNYLISRFDCCINNKIEILKNVKYKLSDIKDNYLIFGRQNEIPMNINFAYQNKYVLKIEYNSNCYHVLFPTKVSNVNFFIVKHLNINYYIALSNQINICTDKENILNVDVSDINYSHHETMGNILLIYFLGKRNFVVILQNQEVKVASYYDEFNQLENEKLFLCKLKDCLNHGKVFRVKNNFLDKYLVYLDDYELNLKPRFLFFTFLDCLLAENYKYCNELLIEDIKQKESKNIKNFFPEFDFYFEMENNVFALIKKDTLTGIFKFESNNLKVTNIIAVDPQHF